jgi:hypothetical protein
MGKLQHRQVAAAFAGWAEAAKLSKREKALMKRVLGKFMHQQLDLARCTGHRGRRGHAPAGELVPESVAGAVQDLFAQEGPRPEAKLEQAVDSIRARFGDGVIGHGRGLPERRR